MSSLNRLPQITAQMANEEDGLSKKFAEGGMTVTEPSAADIALAVKTMAPYWDESAKTRGAEAQDALATVRAALGR